MLNEEKILSGIKNKKLRNYYEEFSKSTGSIVKFERLVNRVRSQYYYEDNSNEFIIRLRDDWREVDLAHELMHGKIMFLDKYGLIVCVNALCELIRAYMEDIIVHENILNEFEIIPFDRVFIRNCRKWTRDLFKRGNLRDSYWDPKGIICNQLHKAFLYMQVWHFNYLISQREFERFLEAFRRSYRGKKEMELADEIIKIIKRNKLLSSKENYDNALEAIINIEYLELPKEILIKHYEKDDIGFVLK